MSETRRRQFHSYELRKEAVAYSLKLKERLSTDAEGIAAGGGR